MENRKPVVVVAAVVLVALFLVFVWPTPYQYFKSGSVNLRSNRITGSVQVLRESGWSTYHPYVEPLAPPTPQDQPVSAADMSTIESDPKTKIWFDGGSVYVSIHNPLTAGKITSLTVMVSITKGDAKGSSETYLLKQFDGGGLSPLSDGTFTATYVYPPAPDGFNWEVLSATWQ